MDVSLVGVTLRGRLCRQVRKDGWERHQSRYEKIHGKDITQGNFGHVSRRRLIDPDGRKQTLVVIKEVPHHAPPTTWQEEHEVECIRRLNAHRFRDHVIKLLNVSTRWTHE